MELAAWITAMACPLHARLQARLLVHFSGLLFAQGRRTVASWLRAAAVGKDYKNYYYFLGSLGRGQDRGTQAHRDGGGLHGTQPGRRRS
jgi:hypothetical protein